MGDPFGAEQEQGKDGEGDLEAFGVEFFLRDRLLTPLRCRTAAKAANFPNHIKIDERSQKRKSHHWDADGVLMKATRRSVNASGGGKSAEADGDAKTAYSDDGGARALQDRKCDARPAKDLWVEACDALLVRRCRHLRSFWQILRLVDHASSLMNLLKNSMSILDTRRRGAAG